MIHNHNKINNNIQSVQLVKIIINLIKIHNNINNNKNNNIIKIVNQQPYLKTHNKTNKNIKISILIQTVIVKLKKISKRKSIYKIYHLKIDYFINYKI